MPSPSIDYWAIREGISETIRSHPDLANLRVYLEQPDMPSPEDLPAVLISMVERESPAALQQIAAGKTAWHRCIFSVWVFHYSTDTLAEAVRLRDAMIARVEDALLADRSLGGRLQRSLELEAGAVISGSSAKGTGFAAAIETLVAVQVRAMPASA
jgi:hypothetical protein